MSSSTDVQKQPYKYNEKELETGFDLNRYDYSARYYDPAEMRFTTIDPLAEKYYSWSPYAYVANNPLRITDPTGEDWRNFLYNVATEYVSTFENIGNAIAHPIETFEKSVAEYNNQSFGEKIVGGIITAADNATMGVISSSVGLVGAVVSDVNGGDGSATGKAAAQATIAVASSKIGEGVGKVVSKVASNTGKAASNAVKGTNNTATSSANTTKPIKSLVEQGEDLVKLNGGKNSVTLGTPNKQIRYDLSGKPHNGVDTPHKQVYIKNFHNGVLKSITRESKNAQSMTQQEIRMIRKYLEKK